jgi:hypothetical protein
VTPEPSTPDALAVNLRVITGSPTEIELAAAHSVIAAVLAEQTAADAEPIEPPHDQWKAGARTLRGPLAPGAGAWQAAGVLRGY